MNLAIRVRDFRYAKGWGPDELASRAEISRTALYQIESGKTGLPRAGTLRRIAVALDVSMEDLLGTTEHADPGGLSDRSDRKNRLKWISGEGGPLALPAEPAHPSSTIAAKGVDEQRFAVNRNGRGPGPQADSIFLREGELMSKLHDLLHSSMGEGVARILDELHVVLPRTRASI